MPTEQEIIKLEEEAKVILSKPIPQRRLGSGVTPQMQKQELLRRQQAQQVLTQIGDYKKEKLKVEEEQEQLRRDLEEYERQRASYERIRNYIADPNYTTWNDLLASERKYVKFLKSQPKQKIEQELNAKEEGLKVVYDKEGRPISILDLNKGMSIPIEVRYKDLNKAQSKVSLNYVPEYLERRPQEIERFKNAGLIIEKNERLSVPDRVLNRDNMFSSRNDSYITMDVLQAKTINDKGYFERFTGLNLKEARAYSIKDYRQQKVIPFLKRTGSQVGIGFLSSLQSTGKFYYDVPTKYVPKGFILYGKGSIFLLKKSINPFKTIKEIGREIKKGGNYLTKTDKVYSDVKTISKDTNSFIMSKGEKIGNILRDKPAYSTGYVLGEAGQTYGSIKAIKYLREPLLLKISDKIDIPAKSELEQVTILKPSGQLDIARYRIIKEIPERQALIIPRYKKIIYDIRLLQPVKSKLGMDKLSKLSMHELQLKYPSAKLIPYSNKKVSIVITEPFIVKDGKIIKPLRKFKGENLNELFVYGASQSASYNQAGKLIRKGKQEIFKLGGSSGRNIGQLRQLPIKNIDKLTKRSLEELKKKGIAYPSNTDIQKGFIETKKTFEKTKGKYRIIQYGKRTATADVTSVMKETSLIEVNKEIRKGVTLNEIQTLDETLAVIDTTYPNMKRIKKPQIIEGKITRAEISALEPAEKNKVLTKSGRKSSEEFLTQLYKSDTLEELRDLNAKLSGLSPSQVKQSVLKSTTNKKTSSVASITQANKLSEFEQSMYYGKGTYEKTQETTALKLPPVEKPNIYFSNPVITKVYPKEIQKPISKEITKSMPKEITKNINREITKNINKEITKQINKQITKQITKSISKQITKNPPRINNIKPPRPIRFKIKTLGRGRGGNGLQDSLSQKNAGYRLFTRKAGKKVYVASGLPRGIALRKGEQLATATLRATFGIERSGYTNIKDVSYKPSSKIFRSYKISKGKKVNTPDTFIQKTRKEGGLKAGRLASLSEREAIRLARK